MVRGFGIIPAAHESASRGVKFLPHSLPRVWTFALMSMVAIFYLANIYDTTIQAQLFRTKWLALLPVAILSWVYARRGNESARNVSATPVVLMTIVLLLSTLEAGDFQKSAMFSVSIVASFVTAYLLALTVVRNQAERQFFDAIATVGRLVIFSAGVMYPLGINLGRGRDRFSAWTDNPNTLALLLAPTLVILMANVLSRRRGWLWSSLPFLVVGVMLVFSTGSRASLLWLASSSLAFFAFRQGSVRTFLIGMALILLGTLYLNEIWGAVLDVARRADNVHDVLSGRSELWPIGLDLVSEKPFLGYGPGSSQEILNGFKWAMVESEGAHFHNSYLTVAVEMGLTGLAVMVILLLFTVYLGSPFSSATGRDWPLRALPWAILIGALTHAFFETWIMSAGNANMTLIWATILLFHARVRNSPSAQEMRLKPTEVRR